MAYTGACAAFAQVGRSEDAEREKIKYTKKL